MPKKKKLSQEELHPHVGFPFRLEHKDGTDTRICHFECEEHRTKYIKRYGLRKNKYTTNDLTIA